MENSELDYRDIIMARYTGEFIQATPENATIKKTSAQIVLDLRPTAEFSINEIAQYLIKLGYQIEFEDSTPFWLMRNPQTKELSE